MLSDQGHSLFQPIELMGRQRFTCSKGQKSVVGAGVAIHGDGIERSLNGAANHGPPDLNWHSDITGEIAEHRGHIRVNHSRTFGHPANAHSAAFNFGLNSDLLLHQIRGENRRRGRRTAINCQSLHERIQTSQQQLHGDWNADDARRTDQNLVTRQAQPVCQNLSGALAIDQTTVSGAGIGLAGIDQHSSATSLAGLQALSTEIHAGRPHHRGGESTGTDGTLRRHHQSQIRLSRVLETSCRAGRLKASGGGDTAFDGRPAGRLRHQRPEQTIHTAYSKRPCAAVNNARVTDWNQSSSTGT